MRSPVPKSGCLKTISTGRIIIISGNKISLSHPDTGVSIVWKQVKDSIWSVYSKPLDYSESIQAKGVRIGYEDTSLLIFPHK